MLKKRVVLLIVVAFAAFLKIKSSDTTETQTKLSQDSKEKVELKSSMNSSF